ncbi:unnamed protein product [Polarella glacialis]|uniref:Uncharacterized protein n=1 Tax=Polarella glacialis TaxID=89957 RepID=A0A813FG39_POLGL|nr:unnamed protein product [Polarella glacialis]
MSDLIPHSSNLCGGRLRSSNLCASSSEVRRQLKKRNVSVIPLHMFREFQEDCPGAASPRRNETLLNPASCSCTLAQSINKLVFQILLLNNPRMSNGGRYSRALPIAERRKAHQ